MRRTVTFTLTFPKNETTAELNSVDCAHKLVSNSNRKGSVFSDLWVFYLRLFNNHLEKGLGPFYFVSEHRINLWILENDRTEL